MRSHFKDGAKVFTDLLPAASKLYSVWFRSFNSKDKDPTCRSVVVVANEIPIAIIKLESSSRLGFNLQCLLYQVDETPNSN